MLMWLMNLGFGGSSAVSNIPQIPGAPKVPSSQISWGGMVAKAEGEDLKKKEPQYEFSNGRTFY